MKKSIFVVLVCIALAPRVSQAQLARFAGEWTNVDTSGGITRLHIVIEKTTIKDFPDHPVPVKLRVWGKCQPTECDWGWITAFSHAPRSHETDPIGTALAITGIFRPGFAEKIVVITPRNEELIAHIFERFIDRSKRTDYTIEQTFRRTSH